MSSNPRGSGYTKVFKKMISAIISTTAMYDFSIAVPQCVMSPIHSPQYTGGFPGNTPVDVDILPFDINPELKYHIRIQHPDSQNHFCYMWGIWYLNMRLLGERNQNIFNQFGVTKIPLVP